MPGNTVVGKNVSLIGQDYLAWHLGVTSQCISQWFSRPEVTGMPEPIPVHYRPGKVPGRIWTMSQVPAWDRWHAQHKAKNNGRQADERKEARAA